MTIVFITHFIFRPFRIVNRNSGALKANHIDSTEKIREEFLEALEYGISVKATGCELRTLTFHGGAAVFKSSITATNDKRCLH
ncbi:hypothetical protein NPIL_374691 [Nephila pilipes]|uniref:Uncharacterized protein n=1 Tax=Nephila pilipes TaxID=299642 RepID=A0A8X6TC73_NEPPI|nr:hypothetical protein NPIL_374691 [Nephila pilipes]